MRGSICAFTRALQSLGPAAISLHTLDISFNAALDTGRSRRSEQASVTMRYGPIDRMQFAQLEVPLYHCTNAKSVSI
jgi:hypothetical protein